LPDPTKARLAAGTLAQKAVNLSRRLDQEGAVTGRDALKKQTDEAAQRLDSAQDRLLKFQSSAQVDLLEARAGSRFESGYQISKVRVELEGEKARLASMERELARQPPLLSAPRAGGADLPRRDTRRDGREETEPPALDISNPFTNPVYGMLQYEVAQSRARVASLEKERKESLGATGGPGAVKELSELYRRKMERSRLQADYDVSLRVYSDLATKYEEARGRVVGIMPQLQIVDAPVQPDRPLPRRFPQFAILGGLIGLISAAVAAVLLNRRAARSLA
jgi:capsule polysaccharide export protein KpsE/RkpR